ncbi:MAG: glycosyltransferase family 2 protein [Verrucomicrobia bacterium]|nr:glycosyltransferase family 2 protein [Verrucomicrobiota bacterium]
MPPEISILVPVYNEQDNVPPLAREIAAALKSELRQYELIFVDDGSTDATSQRIDEAHHADPRVRGVRHRRNAGQSAAFWTGLNTARGSIIGTLDGDLQNDPADLPRLLARLDEADFVCGVRLKRQDDWLRRVSSSVARQARRAALGVDFRDTGCFLRVFRRQAIAGVFPFHGWHRFLPVLAHGAGARVLEIPVNHRPRASGVSKYGVWNRLGRGIWDLLGLAWYQQRRLTPVEFTETPPPP